MSDLQKDAERWRSKVTELIKAIYQVKDGALRSHLARTPNGTRNCQMLALNWDYLPLG